MKLRLAELFRAAGEPSRLRILNILRQGSICVCDLQAVLRLPQPTVSRHLAGLRHAGLVLDFREGPRVLYSLAPATTPQMKTFYEFLAEICPREQLLGRDLETLEEALRNGRCVLRRTAQPRNGQRDKARHTESEGGPTMFRVRTEEKEEGR